MKIWKYLLTPGRHYKVTPVLLYLNMLVFVLMVIGGTDPLNPPISQLVEWGGNARSLTLDNQLWRLLTCLFVHAGLLHLLFNAYALTSIGALLEPAIGGFKFFFGYLFSGLAASIASISFHPDAVSIGASGAVFGLFGMMLSLLYFKALSIPPVARQNLISSILFFVILNGLIGFSAGIDNAAHAGGFIGGLAYGSMLSVRMLRHTITLPVVLSLIMGTVIFALPGFLPNPLKAYRETMMQFSENEVKTQWLHKLTELPKTQTESDNLIYRLDNENVRLWKKNITLLDALKSNHQLPDSVVRKVDAIEKYAQTRLESTEVLINIVKYNAPEDHERLFQLQQKLGEQLNQLNP